MAHHNFIAETSAEDQHEAGSTIIITCRSEADVLEVKSVVRPSPSAHRLPNSLPQEPWTIDPPELQPSVEQHSGLRINSRDRTGLRTFAGGRLIFGAEIRLCGEVVGAAAHDMRNILTPLRSNISAMLGHLTDNNLDIKLFQKNLAKMGYQAEMLERLLDDMRAYSQPTPTDRRRERVEDVIKEAHGMVMDTLHATGRDPACVSLLLEVPENISFEVSRHQIVRAVANIMKNAYESFADDPYTSRHGDIHVEARALDGNRIEIVIKDNGMGLTPEELEDVRRFVPGGTSKKTHGTGFGLPIAKRKIEDHGGSLTIDSKEDEGTVVTITLPVEQGKTANEISCTSCR